MKKNIKGTRAYVAWQNIMSRCYNKNNNSYKYYGGRGIKVCDEWKESGVFVLWYNTHNPTNALEIDRIKNDLGYSPCNCRFVDRVENQQNRRMFKNNKSGYKGVYYCKTNKKWRAAIRSNKSYYFLGYFDDLISAAESYNKWVIENKTNHELNVLST
jgi:hypothetical protein